VPEGYETDISKENYKKIVDIAVPIVSKRYKITFVKDGAIQVAGGEDIPTVNLHNLIGKCIAVKNTTQWEKIIQGHFTAIFNAIEEKRKIDPANYEKIKKYLSIRIYPTTAVNERGGPDPIVVRTDIEGTYSVLMLDLPDAFATVKKKDFESWKKDASEVFRIAQDNINKQAIQKETKTIDIGGTSLELMFLGNENYAASYALDLMNNSPDLVGEWGSVIAMPNKGLVNICKISRDKPAHFVQFIQRTKSVLEESYNSHPQRISNQYYWYYKGEFTKIKVLEDKNGNITVISPVGLAALMTDTK
jgi:hypothetical protein